MDQSQQELFLLFGRFEFALKHGGYLRGGIGKAAEAYWDGFAKKLGRPYFEFHHANLSGDADVREFFALAPRKAVVVRTFQNGHWARTVSWRDMLQPVNAVELVVAIRRVRNNLFHGDKANPDHFRNGQLVRAAFKMLSDAEMRVGLSPDFERVALHL